MTHQGRRRIARLAWTAAVLGLSAPPGAGAATLEVDTVAVASHNIEVLNAVGRDGAVDQLRIYQDGAFVRFSAFLGGDVFQEDHALPAGCRRAALGGAYGSQVDCDMTRVDASIEAVGMAGLGGDDGLAADDPEHGVGIPVLVFGGSGDDTISGGISSFDVLDGGDGQDRLTDTAGVDHIFGGPGNDVLLSRTAEPGDVLDGGSGTDSATFARSTGFRVTLDGTADDGVPGENDDVRVENLAVEGGGATFVGDDGPNELTAVHTGGAPALPNRFEGLGGADRLLGGPGADELLGGEGDDELAGGDGADLLDGGGGADGFTGDGREGTAPGDDVIRARDGIAEPIDCGGAADQAVVDAGEPAPNCEVVDAPAGPPADQAGSQVTPSRSDLGPAGLGIRRIGRDRRAPYVFTIRGRLAAASGRCAGASVGLRVLRGKRVVRRLATNVTETCAWKRAIRLGRRGGRYTLRVTFAGSPQLNPLPKPTVIRLRAG